MEKETTVTIEKNVATKLEQLSKSTNATKKEYLARALAYFEKSGINPVENENPKAEMEKIGQRMGREQENISEAIVQLSADITLLRRDIYVIFKILSKVHPEATQATFKEVKARKNLCALFAP
ncbi:MAG: hypothetical protein LBB79_09550 [Prevotellaceae bacterium]|jgi:hypothetical protein|nr:hypothetical protein [Prevotellaceae bacterium]